ncbi:MAG TPA: TadE family protein [Microbacterium sp.]|nr:TadE family protein [Microbacterium sp.]
MLPWSPSTDSSEDDDPGNQRGSAALEFILLGMLLLVPLVYLIVSLGLIQGQSLGTEAGARHIARALSTAEDVDAARHSAERILRSVVDEYALDSDSVGVQLECHPTGGACPEAGATLVVTIRTTVALPLVPPVLGLDRLASIPVEASAVQKVSRFWEAE